MVSFKDFLPNKSFVPDAIVFFGAKHCEISPTKNPQFGIEKSNKQYIVCNQTLDTYNQKWKTTKVFAKCICCVASLVCCQIHFGFFFKFFLHNV